MSAEPEHEGDVQEEPPPEWVYLAHPDVEGDPVRTPNDPAVLEHQQARGWELTDAPKDAPFVQAANDTEPGEPWVYLVHEGITEPARFPNDPAALQGAYDAGWTPPEHDDEPERPAKRTTKKASTAPAENTEG